MCRKYVCEKTPPVCCADSPLWDGAFGITVQFPVQAQSLRARQRLPPRGSCQNRQVLTEGVQQTKPFPPRRRFRRKQARQLPFAVTTPSRENAMPERPQTLRHCSIKNNFSAEYAQSATTTTAASGGNREELLGQRPARRKCRPRHDADAGCRNPIAERIQNRPARSANAYSVSTRSNRSFAASTASLLPKATRTPPDSTSDRAAACALSRAASTLHSALRSAARISSVMPQKYR